MSDQDDALLVPRGCPPLHEGDLLAYIEGAAPPAIVDLIERVPAYRAAAHALRETDALAQAALERAHCPDTTTLLMLCAGLLDDSTHAETAAHVHTCRWCQAEVAALSADESALPAAAHPQADTWRNGVATRVPTVDLLAHLQTAGREVVATLRPEPMQPALALRGQPKRTLRYQAEQYQIVLALVPPLVSEESWQLEGQIADQADLLAVPHGAQVALWRSDSPIGHDVVDEFGYFAVDNLAPARYDLRISVASDTIFIADLPIL